MRQSFNRRFLMVWTSISIFAASSFLFISSATYNRLKRGLYDAANEVIEANISLHSNRNVQENGILINDHGRSERKSNFGIDFDKRIRKILLWSKLFSGWKFLPIGSQTFDECLESRCILTDDRTLISYCDAVIFHIRTFAVFDVPQYRDARQKWIFFSMEAPPHSQFPGFPFMYNMFNWTMSYRRDSDIVITYGKVIPNKKHGFPTRGQDFMNRIWKEKTKMAVWLVSHCRTPGHRERYVHDLQKYMDVDVLGECGTAVCAGNETTSCLRNFAKKYKFYLAFENAICKDYVTEKFFMILKFNIVPVVFGDEAAYPSMSPPHSYINALDYTPQALAQYLNQLAKNSSQYFEYLKWKEHGYDVRDTLDPCELCAKLHSTSYKSESVYEDIGEWWIKESSCRTWHNG